MQCPVDGAVLVMSERNGIEIDYCPQCRGVWLDRGELDKIVERSFSQPAPAPQAPAQQPYQQPYQQAPQQPYPQHNPRYDQSQPYRHKKRESWLSDLFD